MYTVGAIAGIGVGVIICCCCLLILIVVLFSVIIYTCCVRDRQNKGNIHLGVKYFIYSYLYSHS